ncbi:MAG: ribosome small subunit-dependent GTPase A [Acidimicrobiia bacterium]
MPDPSIGALVPLGWSERVLALYNAALDDAVGGDVPVGDDGAPAPTSAEPGRVVRVERGGAVVAVADGGERLLQSAASPSPPAVGDWVLVAGGEIRAVLDRWSTLSRADPSGVGEQVLAADVDVVVVTAPADRLSPSRVERELAIGWESGARPLVALTKADLAPPGLAEELRDRLVGVDVLATSAETGLGVEALRAGLRPDRTAVLLGPSGAGKSTLANALIGTDVLATGAVREGDHRGRHTTTSRQLLAVPGGGVLIDTPGLRSLGLTGDEGIGQAFPEIDELAAGCRFRDCAHGSEPGCAVNAAVAGGTLAPARLASYQKLQKEMAAEVRRTDPLVRRASVGEWKAVMKSVRDNDKRKPR